MGKCQRHNIWGCLDCVGYPDYFRWLKTLTRKAR